MPRIQRGALILFWFLGASAPSALAQHEGHGTEEAVHDMADAQGLFGPYPASREASGTSWQPQSTPIGGYHFSRGPWMVMVHGFADAVYDRQGGPRGDADAFVPNMGMLMAQRPAGRGTLGLRAMLSLEPATVGSYGYPLLLQTGETADGREPLVDRQHPHDLFMELGVGYSRSFRGHGSAFAYLAFPGEPAVGPPTFMHRFSGMSLPEAPLVHHWLDSTHISFGVATIGVAWKGVKIEGSSFTGREPDEHRWGFDSPKFDSFAGRLSLNATADWALQLSAARLRGPEQLEPDADVDRFTASASYNRPLRGGANWQTTAAWGHNRSEGRNLDGLLLESTWWSGRRHTLFARAEIVEKDELFPNEPLAHAIFDVGKLSAGYIYDFGVASSVRFGIGALGSVFRLPAELEPAYGNSPRSFILFVRGVVR